MIEVPVSWGELADKITILRIKSERMTDELKLANVRKELKLLSQKLGDHAANPEFGRVMRALQEVNESLWTIEDEIRDCENRGDFGTEFVRLARSVYITNDRRADLKRDINRILGSELFEEKSYQQYKIQ